MKVVETIAELKALRRQVSGSVGFVPTMGYLHEGHVSLVKRARQETDYVVASIFVNPTQFGPKEDFASYPRNMERDLAMLGQEGMDIVFAPAAAEMYPSGYNTWVEMQGVTERLEGSIRPGHFRGVATVVAKLFNIVEPTRAYFGQKDAQQVLVVKKMVRDLNMNLEVVVAPTVREPDGLAMSSRNVYLNPEERRGAAVLFRALARGQQLYSGGEKDAGRIRQEMMSLIEREPLAKVEYVSLANRDTLAELSTLNRPAIALLAVKFGKTRLIDNMPLE